MASPRYYLKDRNSITKTPIFLFWYISGQQFKYGTGISIKPRFWSDKKQRIRQSWPEAEIYNDKLDRFEKTARSSYELIIKDKGYFDKQALKRYLDVVKTGVKIEDVTTIIQFIDLFVDTLDDSKRADSTIRSYKSQLSYFRSYCEDYNINLFEELDIKKWEGYTKYLLKQGFSNNYINRLLTRAKMILTLATKDGINKNIAHNAFTVEVRQEETDEIKLSESEIQELYNLDYSNLSRLEKARDIFVIGCRTGLRHSDYSVLSKAHIKPIQGVEVIKFINKKTGTRVVIPIHEDVVEILDKYGGKVPKLSNQKLNDYLKEIAQNVAFLQEKITIKKSEGGRDIIKDVFRWELLSSHTARRSFATNAYLRGWPTLSIMKITGHTTERQFLKYIRVDKEENALRIIDMENKKLKGDKETALDGIRYALSNFQLSKNEKGVLRDILSKYAQ